VLSCSSMRGGSASSPSAHFDKIKEQEWPGLRTSWETELAASFTASIGQPYHSLLRNNRKSEYRAEDRGIQVLGGGQHGGGGIQFILTSHHTDHRKPGA